MTDRFDLDAIEADDAFLDLLAAGGESAWEAGEHDPALKLLADLRLAVEVEGELPVETIDDPERFLARCAALNPVTDPFARKMAARGVALGVAAVAALSVSGVAAAVTGDPLSPYEKVIEKVVEGLRPETSFPQEQLDGMPVVDKTKIVKVAKDYQKKADEQNVNEALGKDDDSVLTFPPAAAELPTLPPVLARAQPQKAEAPTTVPEPVTQPTTVPVEPEQPTDEPTTTPTEDSTEPPTTPTDTTTSPSTDPTTAPTDTTTSPSTDPTPLAEPGSGSNGDPGGQSSEPPSGQTDTGHGETGAGETYTGGTGETTTTDNTGGTGETSTGDTTTGVQSGDTAPLTGGGEQSASTDGSGDQTADLPSGRSDEPAAVEKPAVEAVVPTVAAVEEPAPRLQQYIGKSSDSAAKHSNGKSSLGYVRAMYPTGKHSSGRYAEGRHAAIARAHGSMKPVTLRQILGVLNTPMNGR